MLWIAFLIGFAAPPARAMDFGFEKLQLTPMVMLGTVSSDTAIGNAPSLSSGTLGLQVSHPLSDRFTIGLATDVSYFMQLTEADSTNGNRRALKWNILAPSIRTQVWKVITQLDLQFLSIQYYLNTDRAGTSTALTSSLGGRLQFLYEAAFWKDRIQPGIFFETLYYQSQANSMGGASAFNSPYNVWQVGLTAHLHIL